MIGSIWLEGKMSRKSQADERAAMESATSVATEAVVSIKTVQSLGELACYIRDHTDLSKIDYKRFKTRYNLNLTGADFVVFVEEIYKDRKMCVDVLANSRFIGLHKLCY